MHTCITRVLPRGSELFYVFIFIRVKTGIMCCGKGMGRNGGGQKSFSFLTFFVLYTCENVRQLNVMVLS